MITFEDILAARTRIAPYVSPTPLRGYAALDEEVGNGIRVLVKHENHLPTNAFKARNAMSMISALPAEQRARGVIAATRGNHGAGLAWAGAMLGVPVVICVPHGNNPEKNAAIRGFGAELVEDGRDYDECAAIAARLATERGLTIAHSTNNAHVIAGAGTLAVELFEQAKSLAAINGALATSIVGSAPDDGVDAVVIAVGGGSQAVGAIIAGQRLAPNVPIYGVQAAGAAAAYDSWHAKERVTVERADTFADGLATRSTYDMTWDTLATGLAGFVAVSDELIAEALRMLVRTTHNLAEGAGAAGLAGLLALREELAGKRVAIVLSGSNIDRATLCRALTV